MTPDNEIHLENRAKQIATILAIIDPLTFSGFVEDKESMLFFLDRLRHWVGELSVEAREKLDELFAMQSLRDQSNPEDPSGPWARKHES